MACYIVSFEVASKEAAERIRSKLRESRGYCPITESCCAIIHDGPATAILKSLREPVDDITRAFVIRSGTESAWLNMYGEKHTEWLKSNL